MVGRRLLQSVMMVSVLLVCADRACAGHGDAGDGEVEWTTDYQGTFESPGVHPIDVTGMGWRCNGPGSAASWTNAAGNNVTYRAQSAGGVEYTREAAGHHGVLPDGTTLMGTELNVNGWSYGRAGAWHPEGTGKLVLALAIPQSYFGGLVNSYTSSVDTVSFYSGDELLWRIDMSHEGRFVNYESGTWSAWLNVQFHGVPYNKVVMEESGGSHERNNGIYIYKPVSAGAYYGS